MLLSVLNLFVPLLSSNVIKLHCTAMGWLAAQKNDPPRTKMPCSSSRAIDWKFSTFVYIKVQNIVMHLRSFKNLNFSFPVACSDPLDKMHLIAPKHVYIGSIAMLNIIYNEMVDDHFSLQKYTIVQLLNGIQSYLSIEGKCILSCNCGMKLTWSLIGI